VIATALCLGVHGCDGVEGGAVELSWKLRPATSASPDKFVMCDPDEIGTNPIVKMQLDWEVHTEDGREVSGADQWPCEDSHGVTGFDLPPGQVLLSVKPICPDENPASPAAYTAPAAELRRVTRGDTISLGAVELVVAVSYCDQQPCICQ
jgi:hypothetical protein